tara:strand:- start:7208 stop:7996 length:789 start_codon:yes stop_codon:yes gene_type:complete
MSFLNNNKGYLENKSLIMEGRFGIQHVNALAKAFSKNNELNTLKKSLHPHFDADTGKDEMVPSFEFRIPLPNKLCAKFIENAFADGEHDFPLPININVKFDNEDKPFLFITPKGDYTQAFKRPALAVSMHLEMYVKYNAFKMFAKKMAKHRTYNFLPPKENEPELNMKTLRKENLKFKNFSKMYNEFSPQDKISESRRVFLPRHKLIDEVFSQNLTDEDHESLNVEFTQAASELRKLSSKDPYKPKQENQKQEMSTVLNKIK